jgi:hypothetical protein
MNDNATPSRERGTEGVGSATRTANTKPRHPATRLALCAVHEERLSVDSP